MASTTMPKIPSNLNYSSCNSFAEDYRTISKDYYYQSCYIVTCRNGQVAKTNIRNEKNSGYRCSGVNAGNTNPYKKFVNNGCSRYSGSCSSVPANTFCTMVEYVDCTRVASGAPYIPPTTTAKTTTSRPIATTKKPTTKKPTTKRPTTNRTNRTNKTTTRANETTSKVETPTTKATNNTNIKQIFVNDTDIRYNKTKDTYSLKLKYDVTEVTVNVILEDETSTYTVTGNTEMPNEDHQIKIVVTAVNGDTKEVTLNIKRYTSESSDCTLANIFSEDYPIDFAKNTYSYKLKLPKNVNSIDLEVVPSDEAAATYQIEGNEKLKNNSKITINVRAQDGTTCKYEIKIKKSSNTWKYIVVIVLLLSVLVVASVVLYRYLKKSKGKYKYE